MENIKQWVEFIRDIGLIIGVPTLILIGKYLYERQIKIFKSHIAMLEKELNAKDLLQYDRALLQIESQEKLMERERNEYELKIKKLKKDVVEKDKESKKINEAESKIAAIDKRIKDLDDKRDKVFNGIESEGRRKLKLISEDLGNSKKWIDDYIFGSSTYGYNISQIEQNLMELKGWIEVSDNKIRLTKEGLEIGQK